MKTNGSKLGEVLRNKGLIHEEQLNDCLEAQKLNRKRLGEVLIDKGFIDDYQLTEILAGMFELRFYQLNDIAINEDVLKKFSLELLQSYKIFPIKIENESLIVATNNPLDVHALQDIQSKSGKLVKPVMARLKDIEKKLQEYADSFYITDPKKIIEEPAYISAPVAELVNGIIKQAIHENASDIHFEPLEEQLRVRFRIDGILYERTPIEKEYERSILSRIKIIAGMDVAENRRPQDGRVTFTCDELKYDIRIATLPNICGENLVLRILTKKFLKQDLSSLGMDKTEIHITKGFMKESHGLILLTGPTGSGKTTTLYTILNQLNEASKNIITIENPVEYELPGVNQTSINSLIGYTFASSIRHILRLDPDIIMVGEIRDVETAETSIQAALTGHLVFATIHTNTAAGAITRLLEMNIEPFLINSSVKGVIAQRLVRKLCTRCLKACRAEGHILAEMNKYQLPPNPELCEPVGCEQCMQTGYRGRTGIFEILQVNKTIGTMINQSASEEAIMNEAAKNGMKTLRLAGFKKALEKQTSIQEILRTTSIEE